MVTVATLPPTRPPAFTPAHHVGSPPSSFQNPWPSFNTTSISPSQAFKTRFARDRPAFIPVPDRSELVQVLEPTWGVDSSGFKVTWIGHASFLLETSAIAPSTRGVRILCDPVFSERTSPVSFIGPKRYTPTPCSLSELPDVDIVVISHSHYDHCDLHTLTSLYERRKSDIHFFAGQGNAAWFHSIGVPLSQATELDWWDSVSVTVPNVGAFKMTCTPSQHASGRTPFDRNKTLWCSFVIEEGGVGAEETSISTITAPATGKKVFFAGDTGYRSIPASAENSTQPSPSLDPDTLPHCPAFAQIGQLFGPIDLSLLPIGLCSPRVFMSPVHCNPADSLCVHQDLRSKRSVGMHWGTVRGGISQEYEDVRDPPRWWREGAEKAGLRWRKNGNEGKEQGGDDWEIGLMDVGETIVLG